MRRIALLALAASLTGCLSTSHRIRKTELMQLAQQQPQQRGARVRVLQTFAGDEPPAAPRDSSGGYVYVGVHSHGHGHAGGGGSVSGGGGGRGNVAAVKTSEGKFWFVGAALAAIGFAATEGARYDGYIALSPNHPVHLYGPNGEYMWVPLGQLDATQAAWASRAYIRSEEGSISYLGRRPLDRVGFTYSVFGGMSDFPSEDGTERRGFMSHIQFGYWPAQQLGIHFDIGMGWTENGLGDAVFDLRNALEIDLMPLQVGRFHAGAYGQIGIGVRWEDGYHEDDDQSTYWSVGPMVQIDWTTRLAVTGRAGLTKIYGETASEALIGLSIY